MKTESGFARTGVVCARRWGVWAKVQSKKPELIVQDWHVDLGGMSQYFYVVKGVKVSRALGIATFTGHTRRGRLADNVQRFYLYPPTIDNLRRHEGALKV